jgi:hypothetical protein
MKQIKLPIQIVTIFIIIIKINGIKGFSLNNNEQLNAALKLNRNDLNFEKNIIQFQTSNRALRCNYEIKKLCTKLKKSENIECSSNKFKFLPFYVISNRLSTKLNKINFNSVDGFELTINGNCILTNEAISSNFDKNEIKTLNLNNEINKNEIKLNIEIIDDIDINLISNLNDCEIIFDNQTNVYQLLINNTNYLNSNTILAYLILNTVDYGDYKLKFEIINNLLLELSYDEMKSGLYSIILKNSFNSTKLHETFDYDFRINVNEIVVIKKFQIKFNNENLNELRLISEEEMEEETTTLEILLNNTKSSS